MTRNIINENTLLTLKIGRHSYQIQEDDRFMDNGACVQLLTQSKEKYIYGQRHTPVLSKRAVDEISKFTHNPISHGYSNDIKIFSLTHNSND